MQKTLIYFFTHQENSRAEEILQVHFPFGKIVLANEYADSHRKIDTIPESTFLFIINTFDANVADQISSFKSNFSTPPLSVLIIDEKNKSFQPDSSTKNIFDVEVSTELGFRTVAGMIENINDQNAVGLDLIETERKYNTLIDNLPGITYRCKNNSDWTMVYLSKKMIGLSGYPARDFIYNKRRTFSDIVFPQDREYVWLTVQKALKRNLSFKLEYRIVTASGRIKWVWEHGRAIKDKNDEVLLEGVIMDIDKKKNLEMRLEMMRDITLALSTTNDLTELIEIIKDEVGKATNTENLFLALYDKKLRKFKIPCFDDDREYFKTFPLGKTLNALVIKRNRSIFLTEREIQKFVRQGIISKPEKVPKVWLGVPLQISGKASGIIVIQDFENEFAIHETDRDLLEYVSVQVTVCVLKKQAEDKTSILLQSLEQNPGSVVITDLKGKIIYSNFKSSELTGYDANELIGRTPNILDLNTNDPDKIQNIWDTLEEKGVWRGEFENKTKTDESYWEYALISSIKNHRGKTTHYVYVKDEITKRKKIESELLKAKSRAEESDKLKTAFLANISHEIRTPMNAIIGFAEMLQSDDFSQDEHGQFIGLILENSKKLLSTIDDIIDIAKIESGQLKISNARCSANKILYDNLYAFEKRKEKLGKTHIQLIAKQDKEDENLFFESDAIRINQVILILLENIFKYTTEGTVEMGYSLITENEKPFIDFFTKDSCIGISTNNFTGKLNGFGDGNNNNMNKAGGTGLGLAISRNIAHLMNGNIRIEKNEDSGSTFHFIIPFVESKPEGFTTKQVAIRTESDEMDWTGKTILITEDEDSNFTLLDIMLRKTKARIKRAFNGKQAVDFVIGGHDVDLVLMDVRMPIMNGYEATEYIKKFNPQLPVIIQTAYAMSGDRENSFEAGCDEYLSKPIKATELYRLLKKFLSKS